MRVCKKNAKVNKKGFRSCTVVNVGGDYDEYDTDLNLIPFKGGVGPVTTAVLMSHVLM